MNLYELSAEFQRAMDALRTDEETGEVTGFEAVDKLNAAFEAKAEAYALVIKSLLAEAKAIREECQTLKKRGDAADRRAESLKAHLAQCMHEAGKDSITTPRAGLSFRSSAAVVITDETALPEELCRVVTERRPDKAGIGARLKSGEAVPGAALEQRRNLQIK